MVILGIDPGTATTGYGIMKIHFRNTKGKIAKKKVKRKNKIFKCLKFGCIETEPKDSFPRRLVIISQEIKKLVKAYQPQLVAIEKLFFFRNKKTAIRVSEATGAILLILEKAKVPIIEFSPLQVKKFLTKNGRADKREIQRKVEKTLKIKKGKIRDDAADALAIALYAAHQI